MAELLAFSQTSLYLLPKYRLQSPNRGWNCNAQFLAPPSASSSRFFGTKSKLFPTVGIQKKQFSWEIRSGVVSNSAECEADFGGSNGSKGGSGGGNNNGGESGEGKDHGAGSNKKKTVISMCQDRALEYAVSVGANAVIGYLISGGQQLICEGVASALFILAFPLDLPPYAALVFVPLLFFYFISELYDCALRNWETSLLMASSLLFFLL